MEQFEELDIKRLFKIAIQSINFIVATTILVGIIAFVYSETMVLPTYRSSVTMFVNNKNRSSLLSQSQISGADMQASQMLVSTYMQIIKSETMTTEVSEEIDRRYGLDYSPRQVLAMVSGGSLNNTEILRLSVEGTNPEHTALIANAIADIAPDIISDYIEASNVKIIDRAKNGTRVAPNVLRNTIIGFILGLLYSCAYIVIREVFDTRVKSETDLETWFHKSILGIIPEIGNSDSASTRYYYYRRSFKNSFYGKKNRGIGGYHYGKQQHGESIKTVQNAPDRTSKKK